MNVSITDVSETRKQVTVSLSGAEIASHEKRVLRDLSRQAKIPGFRPGKAPAALLKRKYGSQYDEQLSRSINQDIFKEAVEQQDFKVHSVVAFEGGDNYTAGEDTTVELTLDVQPVFAVPSYTGIPITAGKTEVSDEEVDQVIERLRRERADYTPVERAAAPGDYVQLSYQGTVEGTPLLEKYPDQADALKIWATADNTWEEAASEEGKEYGVPTIIDGVVGMSAGDAKDIPFSFPEDFRVEALRGLTVDYAVTVGEVRERTLPALDEAFFAQLKVDSLEALKDQVLDGLETQKKQQEREGQRQEVLEFLNAQAEFALPQSAVEEETQRVMRRILESQAQQGASEADLEQNKEAVLQQSEAAARRQVKTSLLLGRIAQEAELEVTEEDLSQALMSAAYSQQRDPEELAKMLRRDRGRLMALQRQVLERKTLEFLVDQAKVSA